MERLEKDSIDLSKVNVFKLFWKYFIPTLLGMLGMSAVTAIDGICVGHGVGSDGIAAINIYVPVFTIATGLGLMIGAGCSVVASIHLSRGKVKAARLNVTQAMAIATVATLVPTAAIMSMPEQTALALGSSAHLLPLVVDYLLWFTPALVFQAWEAIALFIIRLDGSPKYAMSCSLVTAVANAVLDVIFIFPLGWGVMGAAFATAISLALGGLMAMGYLLFGARTLRLLSPKLSRRSLMYSLRNVGYQCHIGSPGLVGELTLAVLTFVGNFVFMRHLGDDGVGAFGIACYYIPFIFMVGNATAQSAQPIISYNFGMGLWTRVRQTLRVAIATAVACGLVVTGVFAAAPQLLTGLFISLDQRRPHCRRRPAALRHGLCVLRGQPDLHRLLPECGARKARHDVCTAARLCLSRAVVPHPAGHHGQRRYMALAGHVGDADHPVDSRLHGHKAQAVACQGLTTGGNGNARWPLRG